jgi:hypothetical protein
MCIGGKKVQALFNVTLQRVEMRLGETQEGAGYINVAGGCAAREGRGGRLHASPQIIAVAMCIARLRDKTAQIKDVVS